MVSLPNHRHHRQQLPIILTAEAIIVILLIGGLGFIGMHTAQRLLEVGEKVVVTWYSTLRMPEADIIAAPSPTAVLSPATVTAIPLAGSANNAGSRGV